MYLKRYKRHPYPVSNFLAALVVAQQKKLSQFTYYKFTKSIQQHAEFLYRQGYIFSYSLNCNHPKPFVHTITVNLKYSQLQTPLIRRIHFYSSPNRSWWVSTKDIFRLVKRTGVSNFIISTSSGLRTANECSVQSLSGLLVYKIN